jgi:hypothetical protein
LKAFSAQILALLVLVVDHVDLVVLLDAHLQFEVRTFEVLVLVLPVL